MREDRAEDTEFVTISYGESVEAMSRFAGPDPKRIHHLPRDKEFLIELPESVQVLVDYYDAVWARTKTVLERVTTADFDRIVDENWDPPVTMGVRLVSIVDDDVQHAGQAWYLRGLFERAQ